MAGQLQNLRGTPGKRHEHLARQTQNLPVCGRGPGWRGCRATVELVPGIQSTLLGRTQDPPIDRSATPSPDAGDTHPPDRGGRHGRRLLARGGGSSPAGAASEEPAGTVREVGLRPHRTGNARRAMATWRNLAIGRHYRHRHRPAPPRPQREPSPRAPRAHVITKRTPYNFSEACPGTARRTRSGAGEVKPIRRRGVCSRQPWHQEPGSCPDHCGLLSEATAFLGQGQRALRVGQAQHCGAPLDQ